MGNLLTHLHLERISIRYQKDIKMNLLKRMPLFGLTFSVLLLLFQLESSALQAQLQSTSQTGPDKASVKASQTKPKSSKVEQAIKNLANSFKAAFDEGDAEKVASFWTPEGECIEATGLRLLGRLEIQKAYTEYFKNNKDAKIQISIDSIRQIGENLAIEEGHTVISIPTLVPEFSQYAAIHMKKDGKWMMVSVTESGSIPSATQIKLKDIEWLIGTWTAEDEGIVLTTTYRWLPGKKFIEKTFSSQSGKTTQPLGRQIIGIDPLSNEIMSWTFNSDGGHAIGMWSSVNNGWAIESRGVTAGGIMASANNMITKLDNNGYSWQSVNRYANGVELPDALEVISKRK